MTSTDATQLWLVRHGATQWSQSGQHTSVTDLPLLTEGDEDARRVGARLAGTDFGLVLTSPRRRARDTAAGAGFPDAETDDDLVEWAYGPGEGLTSDEIRKKVPGWRIWTHGAPKFERDGYEPGETLEHISVRLQRVVDRVRASGVERAIVFAHGHSLRALAMEWLGVEVAMAKHFPLQTGTISVLGYEKDNPAIVRWNAED
ncbi:histidine phosphatase family protein [Tessaracoccus antarcticus]|uniref:Histidine phosphatase family protein n=1 Tax=Tessaracoccus antarcticus TaxID=2479848 RepID=A0A3M0G6P3_9ACTN|nr:histidine phosphatase family protein [Tessaracoccus antarcticus]RMB59777.1 histidine phosphatase family protein [Tessaracoccus antarcticus]